MLPIQEVIPNGGINSFERGSLFAMLLISIWESIPSIYFAQLIYIAFVF
jgi:hypothetical protein